MIAAMREIGRDEASLILAGEFDSVATCEKAEQLCGWDKVCRMGWLDRASLIAAMSRSRVGLLLLHPDPNHNEALPVKLFEYMAAGLPTVLADVPLWRHMVEQADCGILVDPFNEVMVAEAIQNLLDDPATAFAMGQRGRALIESKWNWSSEAGSLFEAYRSLLGR